MSIKFNKLDEERCVIFEGSMTYRNSREIENFIIDMMRRYPHVKVDLSEVNEIDRCGVHLLAVLKSFGGDAVDIVATSPVVDVALAHMAASWYGARSIHAKKNRSHRMQAQVASASL